MGTMQGNRRVRCPSSEGRTFVGWRLMGGILMALVSSVASRSDVCESTPGHFIFEQETCFNSTHILDQKGRCYNGRYNEITTLLRPCPHSTDPKGLGSCHDCRSDGRVVCGDPGMDVCNDDLHRSHLCGENDNLAVLKGCSANNFFFRSEQLCMVTETDRQKGIGFVHQQDSCGELYPGFGQCVSCPGVSFCVAGDEEATCESLNAANGLPLPEIEIESFSQTVHTESDHRTWAFLAGDYFAEEKDLDLSNSTFNLTEQTLYVPISDRDVNLQCKTFQGDVNFYEEMCFNSTHTMIVSGTCRNGRMEVGSKVISSCSKSGEAFSYCHDCDQNTLVCSSSDDRELSCRNALLRTPRCPMEEADTDEIPFLSATSTGCVNESTYFYGYEFCGQPGTAPQGYGIYLDSQNLVCSSQYEGMPFCLSCRDGLQLCGSDPAACGPHNYHDELASLSPPLECSELSTNVDFYRERCYNATHTVIWSGECVDGTTQAAFATINSCLESGEGQAYCHECGDSHLVCSTSKLGVEACNHDPHFEESLSPDSDACTAGDDRTSSFGGCVDDQTFFYTVLSCENGESDIQRTQESCGIDFPGFPHCVSCDSFQLCSSERKTCKELGLHSSVRQESPKLPHTQETVTLDDPVECDGLTSNINYYSESCFNETHVQLSQGECISGSKVQSKSVLQSCVEYGEDESRSYCHMCNSSVVCSNSYADTLVCDQTRPWEKLLLEDDLPVCTSSFSHMRGSFGCVDDEVFLSMFSTCDRGQFSAESNGYRCKEQYPGYPYCKTCDGINICASLQTSSCEALGVFNDDPSP